MSAAGTSDKLQLGFLTALEVADVGYVGGLLVTNQYGRPLEFQCTTPVKPNRTQEILYGPTLVPFILSELLGQTLLDKVNVKPKLLLVNQAALLDMQRHVNCPIACLTAGDSALTIQWRQMPLWILDGTHENSIRQQLDQLPGEASLAEPFERVKEALQETLRIKMAS